MEIEARVKLKRYVRMDHLFVHGAHMFLKIANLLPTLWADHLNPNTCTALFAIFFANLSVFSFFFVKYKNILRKKHGTGT
jgi:hypothetical protein